MFRLVLDESQERLRKQGLVLDWRLSSSSDCVCFIKEVGGLWGLELSLVKKHQDHVCLLEDVVPSCLQLESGLGSAVFQIWS